MDSVKQEKPDTPIVMWMLGYGKTITWPVKQLAIMLVHFVIVRDGTYHTPA